MAWQSSVLDVLGGVGAGLAVSVRHDEAWWLVPPVKHQHQQQVPHLVTGAQVVQLTCSRRKLALWCWSLQIAWKEQNELLWRTVKVKKQPHLGSSVLGLLKRRKWELMQQWNTSPGFEEQKPEEKKYLFNWCLEKNEHGYETTTTKNNQSYCCWVSY